MTSEGMERVAKKFAEMMQIGQVGKAALCKFDAGNVKPGYADIANLRVSCDFCGETILCDGKIVVGDGYYCMEADSNNDACSECVEFAQKGLFLGNHVAAYARYCAYLVVKSAFSSEQKDSKQGVAVAIVVSNRDIDAEFFALDSHGCMIKNASAFLPRLENEIEKECNDMQVTRETVDGISALNGQSPVKNCLELAFSFKNRSCSTCPKGFFSFFLI